MVIEERINKKVLHINSYYSAGKFYKNLFDNQVKSGIDLDVFMPVPSNFESNNFDHGKYTLISKNHNRYDRILFHLKHNKILKDVQEQYNIQGYSLIHAHSLFSNGFVAMKLKKKYGIPYIVAVRNTDVNMFFKKMIHLRSLGLEILKNANRVIFLSKAYKEQVIKKYVPEHFKDNIEKKVSVIPNGIDDFWINYSDYPRQETIVSPLRLLHVGDISKNKNIETTVKAIEILIDSGYDVTLDVVGKIKDQRIFNRIKDLAYVNYLGFKRKEKLIKIYRNNDIFVLPSKTETFGLVYAEAMSQGLPVIYTRGQGFDEQFPEGEVGYSVDCHDASEIADKIISISDAYGEISGRCVDLCGKFDWNVISEQYMQIYEKIIDANN